MMKRIKTAVILVSSAGLIGNGIHYFLIHEAGWSEAASLSCCGAVLGAFLLASLAAPETT